MGALILQVACAVCSLPVVSAESLGQHICSCFKAHYRISAANKKSLYLFRSAMSDRPERGGRIKVSNVLTDKKKIGTIIAVHEPATLPQLTPCAWLPERWLCWTKVRQCRQGQCKAECWVIGPNGGGHDLSIDYLYSMILTEVSEFDKQGCCLGKESNLISKEALTEQPYFPHWSSTRSINSNLLSLYSNKGPRCSVNIIEVNYLSIHISEVIDKDLCSYAHTECNW